jgi:hypothetical protein
VERFFSAAVGFIVCFIRSAPPSSRWDVFLLFPLTGFIDVSMFAYLVALIAAGKKFKWAVSFDRLLVYCPDGKLDLTTRL